MDNVKLPTLIKLPSAQPKKRKILLLSDDLRLHSGIATVSRDIVVGTSHIFDWVQLGAGLNHPDHGKIFDISDEICAARGLTHASAKIYAHNGYGNPKVLREIIDIEKPDAILHFTDPRFWGWLYVMEREIHSNMKLPIMYYNIWDAPPAPRWNWAAYQSCDLLMNISKQTNILVKLVLGKENYVDFFDGDGNPESTRKLAYVPHGINHNLYKPLSVNDPEWGDYLKFKADFESKNPAKFIVLWNNRNIRRKMPGDVILAYRKFCEGLSPEDAKKCLLIMKTDILDENGTDLGEVVNNLCPKYRIVFVTERLPSHVLNFFYNIADVTVNIASNEGFGLATAESVMSGTPIIVNVTGGLQDQCNFMDFDGNPMKFSETFTSNHDGRFTKHGEWAFPIYPSSRSLQGSIPTPYIFDDRCEWEDAADELRRVYDLSKDERIRRGLVGREWMMSSASGMSADNMCERMTKCIDSCIDNFVPKPNFDLEVVGPEMVYEFDGINID